MSSFASTSIVQENETIEIRLRLRTGTIRLQLPSNLFQPTPVPRLGSQLIQYILNIQHTREEQVKYSKIISYDTCLI